MTGKADFTEAEWELLCEGPATAGLLAASASQSGSIGESWAIAKVYAEAREARGASELLDDLVADKPEVKSYHSAEEVLQEGLRRLEEAVTLLEQKAPPGEVAGYKHFTLDVAGRAVEAHKEEGEIASVGLAEREAIEKIVASLYPR